MRKNQAKSICKFYFSLCYLLVGFLVMAAIFCFTFKYSSASPNHKMTPSFILQPQWRGSILPALSDLPNTSPKARWGTHTAEIIIAGQCNILCQDPVVPDNAHIWDACIFKASIWSVPIALWHSNPQNISVLGTEAIIFSPSAYIILTNSYV